MFLFWHFLAPVWFGIFFKFETGFCCLARGWVPWVPEVFLACEEELRRPQADTYSAEGRRHERQLKTWPKPETAHEKPLEPRVVVGLCNYVPTLILGGVQGLFAGFVQYVLGGLLIVTSLVVGFLGYTLELFCNVCNLPVIVLSAWFFQQVAL